MYENVECHKIEIDKYQIFYSLHVEMPRQNLID